MEYADKKPRILIDKMGNWYQDGIKITHRWTYLENNRNLDKDEKGRLFVDEGTGRVYVEAEDTPFVVKMVTLENDKFYAVLNDETKEEIDLEGLWISNENVPYINIKDKRFTARFLRPAYYEFSKYMIQEGDDFFVLKGQERIRLNKQD